MTAAAMLLLNHFFVTPSRETFDAVWASEFVQNDLGAVEKRTTVRKDRTYTGLYLYGEDTYLELLHPDSNLGAPSGIAWHGRIGEPELVYRGDAPWFLMSNAEPKLAGLADWGMEYVEEFFQRFHPGLPPARPGTSRADALTRYAASCGKLRERSEGLFENVAALEVSLSPADLISWRTRAARFEDIEIRITPAERTAITAARLELRRDAGRGERKLGTTTLSLDGRTAVWRFEE